MTSHGETNTAALRTRDCSDWQAAATHEARDDAAAVLAADPVFDFAHWPSFDWRMVAVLQACAHAGLAEHAEAVAAVNPVRAHPLAAADPATWIVEGTRFASFEAAAIALVGSAAREFALR